MKTEQEQLAECRAHWEATKPDAVFADYWPGWKAARESLVIELPKIINKDWACDSSECEFMRGGINLARLAILAAGVKVKS